MKFGNKIILINSLILSLLTAIIVAAAAVAGTTVLRSNIHNALIETVTSRASLISASEGPIPPDGFDYDVNGVYLSVYFSDGTLNKGSFPGPVDLPIQKGVVSYIKIDGERYYVYDFAVSLEGREDIYLRGIVSASYGGWFAAVVSVTVFAGVLAVIGIFLNVFSVKRAVRPIDRMRREVNDITLSKDIAKRLSEVPEDVELAQLAEDYNYMLDSLEGMFRNHERFTSDVAHELRTPLTVILSESEYALDEGRSESDKDESLAVIYRQSKRLKAITDSLLEFTRVANRLKAELSPTDISALTEEFLGDYPFPEGVACKTEIEEGVVVLADITLFERLLQNLVDNAVKYGREGGHVIVSLGRKEGRAALAIEDDGIGMSEETLSHIFERFYRAEPSRSDKSGLGLGMSFVKEIARLLGAEIHITSALGKGTRVTLTFALSQAPEPSFG